MSVERFIDSFQEKIWRDKYQYNGETYDEFCFRIASNIFAVDETKRNKLLSMLLNFEVLFGGRINANIGVDEQGLTLFNCYIAATIDKNMDSLEGILDLAKEFALTLKSEGGIGICANFLRPARTLIKGIGVTSPGSVKFLEIFDKISEVITAGGTNKSDSFQGTPTKNSIRKGATMVTLSCCHPDIEDFIMAKAVPNRLTKMNMSVLVTDAFMYAVENDLDWDLWYPETKFEKYDLEWDGNFEKWAEKGYPFIIYKTLKAVELWELILKSSHTRNEPGILFVDTMRRYNNLAYLKGCEVNCTNPCVVEGTLVTTDNGLFPVEQLKINDTIQTSLGFGKIKEIKVYENQDIYRVHFSDGFYQDVTKGHIFHTMFNGVESRKRWNNEKRLTDIDTNYFVRKSWYNNYPTINNKLSRDEGLLIGLYLGDGCYSNNQCFNISSNSTESSLYIEELFKRLGGGVRVDDSEGNCVRHYFTNKKEYLDGLFDIVGIDPSNKAIDLKKILNTNKQFILGLIDGLISSDGNVNLTGNYPQLRFDNSNFGIHTLIKHLMLFIKADYKVYPSKKIGERSKINGRFIERKQICYTGIIDNDSILNFFNELGYISHEDKNKKLIKLIKTSQLTGVKWKTKIKKIEYLGVGRVYDLYEPIADDWNHEGFVSRGCGEVFSATGKVNYKGEDIKIGDVCDLGSINVVKFYNVANRVFDFGRFNSCTALMAEALDNIIDISGYPLEQYELSAKLRRKIGVGITGIGSLFMMMNIRYGGKESMVFLEELLSNFMNTLYKTSAMLAKEKGTFELYSEELLESGYVSLGILNEETIALIKKHGLRNCALSAIAPNGTLSILAGNISGGIEPVFSKEFFRWNRVETDSVGFVYPNVHKGEWFETDYLRESMTNGEVVLDSKDGKYRVDKNTGLCRKVPILDYGYSIARTQGFKETLCAQELSIEEHLNVLSIFSKYIDLSVSKTINLPNDISFEDFKALYGTLHKYGIKGCTTYREGTTIAILESAKQENAKTVKQQQQEFLEHFKEQENGDIIFRSVKLPDEYPSRGYVLKTENKKWYLHVAFKDRACTRPFAIFVNTNNKEDNVVTYDTLEKMEEIARYKGLPEEFIEETKRKYAYQKNPVKICRMVGLLLRHNIDVHTIVKGFDELDGAGPGTFVFRIKKFLAQFIQEHDVVGMVCPECGEKAIRFYEGCFTCTQCGSSKCS